MKLKGNKVKRKEYEIVGAWENECKKKKLDPNSTFTIDRWFKNHDNTIFFTIKELDSSSFWLYCLFDVIDTRKSHLPNWW